MHHIYTTPAFIVHSSPYGEAGKFLLLFTKSFGMIGAVAQGIRLSQSKLRYHMQDANFSNISVVRGKEVWRVTGAHELPYTSTSGTILHLKILKLLKRLLHGEEKNEKLFEIIECLYKTEIGEENYESVECLTILRILNTLGYISNKEFSKYIEDNSLDRDLLESFKIDKKKVVEIVNSALKASHL